MSSSSISAPDIPLIILVPNPDSNNPNNSKPPLIQSERRINPSWTFAQFKAKMEPITGIPPGCMRVEVRGVDLSERMGEEERVERWGVGRGDVVTIHDNRPPSLRQSLLFDPSAPDAAPKYTMPSTTYESLSDSVLAWKKANHLGRFDPTAPQPSDLAQQRSARDSAALTSRHITLGSRCRVGGSDTRRGSVAFIGAVPEIGNHEKEQGAIWVGVSFDEPVGKNDGSISGVRYFECAGDKFGAFVRPENVEVGEQYGKLDDLLEEEDDLEEI